MRCRTPAGEFIVVDPHPLPGGEFIVNGARCAIVAVRNTREAATARRRDEQGFVPHQRYCPRQIGDNSASGSESHSDGAGDPGASRDQLIRT